MSGQAHLADLVSSTVRPVTISQIRARPPWEPQHPFDRRASADCNVHRAALEVSLLWSQTLVTATG